MNRQNTKRVARNLEILAGTMDVPEMIPGVGRILPLAERELRSAYECVIIGVEEAERELSARPLVHYSTDTD